MVAAATIVGSLSLCPGGAFGAFEAEMSAARVAGDPAAVDVSGAVNRNHGCAELPALPELPEPPEESWTPPDPTEISVNGPDSAPYECGSISYLTAAPPSGPECADRNREWGAIGAPVQQLWSGSELDGPGAENFDLKGVALGADPVLLCLAVVETVAVEGPETLCSPFYCSPSYELVHTVRLLRSFLLAAAPVQVGVPRGFAGAQPPCRTRRPAIGHPRVLRSGRVGLSTLRSLPGKGARARKCRG
jgi:hypothetical protein